MLKLCKVDEAKRKKISEMGEKNLKFPTSPHQEPYGILGCRKQKSGQGRLTRPYDAGRDENKGPESSLTFGSYLFSLIF